MRRRQVACYDNKGLITDKCELALRPSDTSICNEDRCPGWRMSPWSQVIGNIHNNVHAFHNCVCIYLYTYKYFIIVCKYIYIYMTYFNILNFIPIEFTIFPSFSFLKFQLLLQLVTFLSRHKFTTF